MKDYTIRQLHECDAEKFCELIIDMYGHLDNPEWFSPMPFDIDSVKGMINNPRFYIIGLLDSDRLVGVSSLDYKCGKLIGKIDFPPDCDVAKLVEIGFNIVHSDYRGNGLMKILLDAVIWHATLLGYTWIFAKVHNDNIASYRSIESRGLTKYCSYLKPIDKVEFENLAKQLFFSKIGRANAMQILKKYNNEPQIITTYNIYIKKINSIK